MDNTRAAYRILDPNGFYADDDTLYIVDADGNYPEIYFDGIPNEQMEPLNELARERLTAYLENLDRMASEDAKKLGRTYNGRPRTLDGAIMLATEVERSKISIMGAKEKTGTTERVEAGPTPETGSINPRKPGRPKGSLNKSGTSLVNAA